MSKEPILANVVTFCSSAPHLTPTLLTAASKRIIPAAQPKAAGLPSLTASSDSTPIVNATPSADIVPVLITRK